MPRAKSISKDDTEHENRPVPALRRSSRKKTTENTPLRPTLDPEPTASTSSYSSSSSSSLGSSASSLFDRSVKSLDTPLSTPVSEDSTSIGGEIQKATNEPDLPQLSFKEKLLKQGLQCPTQDSTGSAKTLDNDDLILQKFRSLSLLDDAGLPNDRPSRDRISDKKLSEGTPDKRRCHVGTNAKDACSKPRTMSCRPDGGGKGKARSISQLRDMLEWREQDTSSDSDASEGRDVQSSNPGQQPTLGPSKRTFSQVHDNHDGVGEPNESSASLHCLDSLAIEADRGGESALLKPQRSHQRSKSAQIHRHERLDTTTSTEVLKPRQSSPGITTPSETHKNRRRSTGSLDAAARASSSATDASQIDHGGSKIEPESLPRPKKPRARGRRSQGEINMEKTFPELKHKCTPEKDLEELKAAILDKIRGKNVSKYARLRAIRSEFDKQWKAWFDTSGKTPRTAAIADDGHIYIFRSKPDAFPGSKYVKIGMTKQPPEKRRREWTSGCGFEFVHIRDPNDKRFLHFRTVEKIIHTELYNERRKYTCNKCHREHQLELGENSVRVTQTEHGEWFEISEEKALEIVNKWRDWVIKNEPYKPDGSLRARWEWKCKAGSFWMNGTEADWIVWRTFSSVDTFRYVLKNLKNWLENMIPPLIEILNAQGAIFGLALIWYFWAWGFNFGSCFALLAVGCIPIYFWFQFC